MIGDAIGEHVAGAGRAGPVAGTVMATGQKDASRSVGIAVHEDEFAAGIAAGLAGAALLARVMQTLLFGVDPLDPATFAGASAALAIVALAACYLPARRAMKVDPAGTLR